MAETMIIKNDAISVIALKAAGMPILRLMPGYNTVDRDGFKKYFNGNPAAQGQQKINLSVVDGGELSPEDKEKADLAKEKNDRLNKAQKLIAKQNKAIKENEKNSNAKDNEIAELKAAIEELKSAMEKKEDKPKKVKKEKKEDK